MIWVKKAQDFIEKNIAGENNRGYIIVRTFACKPSAISDRRFIKASR